MWSYDPPRLAHWRPLLAVASLVCLVGLAVDAVLIGAHRAGRLDRPVLTDDWRDDAFTPLMKGVTTAAEYPLIIGSLVVALLLAWAALSWRPLALVVAAGLLSVAAASVAKSLADRVRPPRTYWLVHETGYSFPSRHTTMAAALLFVVAYLLCGRLRSSAAVAGVWTVAAVLVALVGTSRVYLGVHWATDVVGGFFVGSLVALVLMGADLVVRSRRTNVRGAEGRPI
ncbi:phosphatase PAP2 family protein [Actinomadura atramentaria]|uniref:phosphatase PAP2 family protein n=1 Tax=Actinomadura atramentaria TaxID=1990 RepID=UPI00037027AD|nr:phosphatase PAP2 family protein [Actinomadura atramentaria]